MSNDKNRFQKYVINKDYRSVYHFLKDNGFSENYITNLRKKMGNIVLNGQSVTIRTGLKQNDILEINSNPNTSTSIMQCIIPLDIVYEDDYYLLVNKPSGLACMPSRSHYYENLAGAICYYMRQKMPSFTLRIINRLDKDTSGIIIVAKDSIAQKEIKDIDKIYYALCEGKIDKEIMIDANIQTITENGINQHKRIVSPEGKPAKTYVEPIRFNDSYSLIKLKLENGRTHQIRVHLSSIGHPLVGDCIYGNKSEFIDHTVLLCSEISFYHPFLNKTLTFKVPFPKDFEELASKLLQDF